MKEYNRDKVIAGFCLILGIAYVAAAWSLPETNLANDPGPKIFPLIGGSIVILSSLAILIKSYAQAPKPYYTAKQWKKAGAMLAVFIAYAVLLWAVGYLIATPIALLVTSFMFTDEGQKVALWKRLVFAAALTAFLYWIFAKVLVMLLPVGFIFK